MERTQGESDRSKPWDLSRHKDKPAIGDRVLLLTTSIRPIIEVVTEHLVVIERPVTLLKQTIEVRPASIKAKSYKWIQSDAS